MITVLVKNPGKPARVREIDEKLSTLQELVGGYIEALPTDYDVLLSHIPGICAFCNEEGKLNGMPANFTIGNIFNGCYDVVCGPVVFAGRSDEDIVSLTDDQIARIKNFFKVVA